MGREYTIKWNYVDADGNPKGSGAAETIGSEVSISTEDSSVA